MDFDNIDLEKLSNKQLIEIIKQFQQYINDFRKDRLLFSFDLDQENLAQYYPKKHQTHAYREIGIYFQKNGFEHNQGSGYLSKESLTITKGLNIADDLYNTFPWISKCSSVFVLSQISKFDYDIKEYFDFIEKRVEMNKIEKHNDKEITNKK